MQILGCILNNPMLLDEVDRPLSREDFNVEAFHEIIFAAMFNLYNQGCNTLDEYSIDSFLSNYDKQYKIYQDNKGNEYISNAREMADSSNYDYYYHRLRKYTILRYYESCGFDTRSIYDSTIVEPQKAEEQQFKFDSLTEQEIIDQMENIMVTTPRMKYTSNTTTADFQAGHKLDEIVDRLMETPDIGIALSSKALNTVTRGARLKKFYLRSSNQGGGKSRMAAADVCSFAVPWYYDTEKQYWHYTGMDNPATYITTEMEYEEVVTMFAAYVSGVDESHILEGKYQKGELERVRQAIQYIKSAPLYVCHIPDFSIEDITNIIKRYKREHGVKHFCFDYIHTSLKLIAEIASASKGMKMREDNLLLAFADTLKSLCNKLGVFIFSSTQLNADYADSTKEKNQNLLRGAKSIADKIDVGIISLAPTIRDLEAIKPILSKMVGCPEPNMCQHVYKCRRGKLVKIIIWQKVDLGTCRTKDLFVTKSTYELINVDFTTIENVETVEEVIEENSIRSSEIEMEVEEQEEATAALFSW